MLTISNLCAVGEIASELDPAERFVPGRAASQNGSVSCETARA
jgi:hypothetical protein